MAWYSLLIVCLPVSICQVDSNAGIPGQRLGARGPIHIVEEINAFPEPDIWFNDYSRANKAVVIKGGAKLSPAYTLWTDEYFAGKVDALPGNVVTDSRVNPPKLYTFEEFLNMYKESNMYMVHSTPEALRWQ